MSHTTLLDLSRWQWALTAAFHITFPAVTVGTSVLLVVCYAMYVRTDDPEWLRMFRSGGASSRSGSRSGWCRGSC
jgi:cytochrome bd ubiquinol oxidase subunit I